MKTTVTQWATKAAGAGAIALLLATPAFAQSRGDWNRNNNTNNDRNAQQSNQRNNGNQTYGNDGQRSYQRDGGNRSNDNNSYRENQRVNATGKVTSFNRERDGYRVQLDRGQSFWVPQAKFGNRARDLRVGVSISLGGIFRGGSIYADAVSWPDYGYGYQQAFVRGLVERVDYRTGTVWLRDNASGRLIAADVNGRSLRTLRRGEYVELTGQWIRGGVFDVASIGSIRGR
jgi:hypothetical protein